MSAPVVVVIEHSSMSTLGRFAGWLRGVTVRVVRPYAGDEVPTHSADGLIVLGGPMAASDDEGAPWLPAVRALMAASVADGTPTLGVCLGAQLLALACGGTVDVGAAAGRELGVANIRWLPSASLDPLVHGLPNPTAAPSLHFDAIAELPVGAVWLGSSELYQYQAFRVGSVGWGVQFHPEVSLDTYRTWAARLSDVDVDLVSLELQSRYAEATIAGRMLARRFSSLVERTWRLQCGWSGGPGATIETCGSAGEECTFPVSE